MAYIRLSSRAISILGLLVLEEDAVSLSCWCCFSGVLLTVLLGECGEEVASLPDADEASVVQGCGDVLCVDILVVDMTPESADSFIFATLCGSIL